MIFDTVASSLFSELDLLSRGRPLSLERRVRLARGWRLKPLKNQLAYPRCVPPQLEMKRANIQHLKCSITHEPAMYHWCRQVHD